MHLSETHTLEPWNSGDKKLLEAELASLGEESNAVGAL